MSPKPVATIDLHGYRKEEAIASVTQFLHATVRSFRNSSDGGPLWVCIITGSGHHSHSGPVLREAVRSLLDKREMEYTLQYGKGSYLVNARSGHELIKPSAMATDTKIVVQPSSSSQEAVAVSCVAGSGTFGVVVHRPHVTKPTMMSSRRAPLMTTVASTKRTASLPTREPLPSEVAADDELLDRIKSESKQHYVESIRREKRLLQVAMTTSKRELEHQQLEQEEALQAALRQSQQEEELIRQQEKAQLESMLRHSREEEERIQQQEKEKLAFVLAESQQEELRQEQQEEEMLKRALSLSQVEVSGHDQALEEALKQSMHDVHAVDSELNEALSLSLHEQTSTPSCEDVEEETLFEKVLQLSLAETHSQSMPEFVEHVDYYIEEVD